LAHSICDGFRARHHLNTYDGAGEDLTWVRDFLFRVGDHLLPLASQPTVRGTATITQNIAAGKPMA